MSNVWPFLSAYAFKSEDIGNKQIDEISVATKTIAEQEEVDIDLNDPEVEKAAIKIQAGFSRFKSKKQSASTPEV